MSTPEVCPESNPITDEALDTVRQIADVLRGAMAMRDPSLVRGAVSEAYSAAAQLVDALERQAAVAHEKARTNAGGAQ